MRLTFAIHINHGDNNPDPWQAAYSQLVKAAAHPNFPADVRGFKLLDRVKSLVQSAGVDINRFDLVLVITGGRSRPPHPPIGINVMPQALAGWFIRVVEKGTPLDKLVEDQRPLIWGHLLDENIIVDADSEFAHLTDSELSELLGCYRMLNFQTYPAWAKGKEVPHGVQLLEEVQRRLKK